MKTLIVIDIQNDFVTGSLGSPEAEQIIPGVVRKIELAQAVWYTLDTHGKDYLNTQEGKNLPVEHCVEGTQGWELRKDVSDAIAKCRERGIFTKEFRKPTFGSVEMAKEAANCYEKYKSQGEPFEVELVGLCTDICVISNALLLKAFVPEMKVAVDASCCAGVTPEKHLAALQVMESCQIIRADA